MDQFRVTLFAFFSVAVPLASAAQETAPYPNGTSGIKAGSVPPPGYYWLMYNRLYEVEEIKGADGETIAAPGGGPLGASIRGYANVHRFIHVTDYEIGGANYSWNAVLPFIAINNRISGWDVEDSDCRIGDVNLEPLVLEWHKPQYDFGVLYGLFVPTSSRDDNRPALPGKAYWTHYVGAAGTYFSDEERTWSASFLSRYEMSSSRYDKDVQPGDNFSFEWGVARNFNGTLDIGISGFCSWQTTLDRGSDVTYTNVRDRAFGIGPEIQYFSPKYNFGYHFRFWPEFGVRDRSEGTIATLTFVKPL